MAYFSRLILLLCLFPCFVFAANTPRYSNNTSSGPYFEQPDGAILKAFSNASSWNCISTCGFTGPAGGSEYLVQFPGGQMGHVVYRSFYSCPGDQIWDFAQSKCIDPPPECPPAGEVEGSSSNAYTTDSKVPANNLCIGQCSWSAGGVVPSVCANGKCYYYGPFTSNGTACTGEGGAPAPEEPDPAPPDDAQCVAKGQCPGTINGTKVCVPCSSKEGTTSESGSSSSEGTDSSGAPTGGTGTTNTTKETTANCTNGSCNTTTTVTVTAPDGSTTTTTETESKPQEDFCKSNPGHIVCKGEDEGTFGGSCASGFQCSGDAVQCAQAEAGWKSACASDVSGMTEQINTGTVAMAAGAASGLGIPGGSDAFDLGSRLSEVPLFGSSGGCPSDVSVNVGGTSYTIAFSAMCPQLQVLGVALMAFAYLVAGFIVFRGDRS